MGFSFFCLFAVVLFYFGWRLLHFPTRCDIVIRRVKVFLCWRLRFNDMYVAPRGTRWQVWKFGEWQTHKGYIYIHTYI